MKRFYILGFLSLIFFDTLAQVSFKYASIHAEPLAMDVAWLARVFGHPGSTARLSATSVRSSPG